MIFLSDDYLTKYSDVLSYLIARSYYEKYSFDYIQKTIAYSKVISELERSNITPIAFSSLKEIYEDTFPYSQDDFIFNEYNEFGWIGTAYMHLFLNLKITFEALFFLVSIEEMLGLYHLYHEMSFSQIDDYVSNKLKYTTLDIIMKRLNISCKNLSDKTRISQATISALRYKQRDIAKLEANKLLKIAIALNVKTETLLPTIYLNCEWLRFYVNFLFHF